MDVAAHTIELDGSPVFYRSAPAPGTPPVYLHDVVMSADDLTELLALTGGVAPDLPGFGRTGKGGHLDYTLPGLAAFVESLLDELALDEVALVGHGWGAAVALELAARRRRVSRVVAINPLALVEGFAWPRPARLWRTPVVGELVMGATTRRLLARQLRRGGGPAERIATVWEHFDQGTQRAILRLHRATDAHHLDTLGPLAVPALVVWGDSDPWLPAALADPFARLLPGARVERIEGAGHWPWLDRPEVIDTVGAFL